MQPSDPPEHQPTLNVIKPSMKTLQNKVRCEIEKYRHTLLPCCGAIQEQKRPKEKRKEERRGKTNTKQEVDREEEVGKKIGGRRRREGGFADSGQRRRQEGQRSPRHHLPPECTSPKQDFKREMHARPQRMQMCAHKRGAGESEAEQGEGQRMFKLNGERGDLQGGRSHSERSCL